MTCVHAFSRACRRLRIIALSFNWLTGLSVTVVITREITLPVLVLRRVKPAGLEAYPIMQRNKLRAKYEESKQSVYKLRVVANFRSFYSKVFRNFANNSNVFPYLQKPITFNIVHL